MDDCALCMIHLDKDEQYRVVRNESLVYAVIPREPLVEGHVMVLPKAHKRLETLSADEHLALGRTLGGLKDKLVELYPANHPIIATLSDTDHASIPDHVHYHMVPSEVTLRKLFSAYDPNIHEKKILLPSKLERMAGLLR